MAKMMVLF